MYHNRPTPRTMSPQSTPEEHRQNDQTPTITSCPSPLCVSPIPTVLKTTSSSLIGGVVNLCGTGREMMTPQKFKSIQDDFEGPVLEGPSDELYSLLSGSSDRKSRRKMVMRPVSCHMFWDQGTSSQDVSAAEASNTGSDWISIHNTSPVMKSAYFDSCTPQSETPLTTPGSNGILSGTHTRQDQTLSGHIPFLNAMRSNKRVALRPTIVRFGSLPAATSNSRPKTSRGILDQGRAFEALIGSAVTGTHRPIVEKSTSVDDFFDQLERLNVPSAADVVRFGRALSEALDSYLSQLRDVEEAVEIVDESHWSDSGSEPSDDDE